MKGSWFFVIPLNQFFDWPAPGSLHVPRSAALLANPAAPFLNATGQFILSLGRHNVYSLVIFEQSNSDEPGLTQPSRNWTSQSIEFSGPGTEVIRR